MSHIVPYFTGLLHTRPPGLLTLNIWAKLLDQQLNRRADEQEMVEIEKEVPSQSDSTSLLC